MDIDLLFKIAGIGILVAVLNQVLTKAGREDQAMMTTLTGLIIVLMLFLSFYHLTCPTNSLCGLLNFKYTFPISPFLCFAIFKTISTIGVSCSFS